MSQPLPIVLDPSQAPEQARPALPDSIRRYASGESIQDIALDQRVHRATLYRWMLAGTGDKQYSDLVTHCLVQRVADADEQLEKARDPCDIARARETARYARMDLERRRPALYGSKPDQAGVSFTVVIQAYDKPEQSSVMLSQSCAVRDGQRDKHA